MDATSLGERRSNLKGLKEPPLSTFRGGCHTFARVPTTHGRTLQQSIMTLLIEAKKKFVWFRPGTAWIDLCATPPYGASQT